MTQEEIVKRVETMSSEINYGFSMPVHWKVQKEIAVYLTKSKIEMLERLKEVFKTQAIEGSDETVRFMSNQIDSEKAILKALEDGNN